MYLSNDEFDLPDGKRVQVSRSCFPGLPYGMEDLIARHKGRYCLLGLFSRPGYHLLDFPCGSGYAAGLLAQFGVLYEGKDIDEPTIVHANRCYGTAHSTFSVGDLCSPELRPELYNAIGCIEGLEHIPGRFQGPLVAALHAALKPGGTLVVSSPEASSGASGPNPLNEYHKHELTKEDFLCLLRSYFDPDNIELVTHRSFLHTGVLTNCLYGICYKKPP